MHSNKDSRARSRSQRSVNSARDQMAGKDQANGDRPRSQSRGSQNRGAQEANGNPE